MQVCRPTSRGARAHQADLCPSLKSGTNDCSTSYRAAARGVGNAPCTARFLVPSGVQLAVKQQRIACVVRAAQAAVTEGTPNGPSTGSSLQPLELLQATTNLLKDRVWEIVLLYGIKDALAFLLHRVSQRMTNHVAESLIGARVTGVVNPWFLHLDSGFLQSNPGYEFVVAFFFLVMLPVNLLLNSAAFATAACLVRPPPRAHAGSTQSGGSSSSTSSTSSKSLQDLGIRSSGDIGELDAALRSAGDMSISGLADDTATPAAPPGPWQSIKRAAGNVREAWGPARHFMRSVWFTDVHFNLRALPLQALSLLLIPAFWMFPRLMHIQLALPCAAYEPSLSGPPALARSRELMTIKGAVMATALPFLGLLLANRGTEYMQALLLTMMPARWWRDVVEIPLSLAVSFALAKTLIARLQDMLPLASYLHITRPQPTPAAAAAGGDAVTDTGSSASAPSTCNADAAAGSKS